MSGGTIRTMLWNILGIHMWRSGRLWQCYCRPAKRIQQRSAYSGHGPVLHTCGIRGTWTNGKTIRNLVRNPKKMETHGDASRSLDIAFYVQRQHSVDKISKKSQHEMFCNFDSTSNMSEIRMVFSLERMRWHFKVQKSYSKIAKLGWAMTMVRTASSLAVLLWRRPRNRTHNWYQSTSNVIAYNMAYCQGCQLCVTKTCSG